MHISAIIATYNEEKYIHTFISNLLSCDYADLLVEFIFIDGGSTDKTFKILSEYATTDPRFVILKNPKKVSPVAFNIGIKAAKGNYVVILGAHSALGANFFRRLYEYHQQYNCENIGGICKTEVLHKNKVSLAIQEVLSNPFGVGNALFRTGISEAQYVDTVAYGMYKREVFEKYGLFNEDLHRNQDIEFNKRIINSGSKILIVPDVDVIYFARETFGQLAKISFANGMWNIYTVYITKNFKSLSIRHFVPAVFVLSIILPALASFIYFNFIYLSVFSLLSYLSLMIYVSFKSLKKNQNFVHLVAAFLILHFSYGVGTVKGIFKIK